MPPDTARDITQKTIGLCVARDSHEAFVQGFHDPDSGVAQLGAERARQGRTGGNLAIVVISLHQYSAVSRILAHELGHIWLGHTDTPAAVALSPEERDERERQAEEFATKYSGWSI